MGFRGFDLPKIHTLHGDLGAASQHAGKLHSDLTGVLQRAQKLMNASGKQATNSPLLRPLAEDTGLIAFVTRPFRLPALLGPELGDMADSIKRRSAQLEGAERLQKDGYSVGSSMLFTDEKPPSEKDVKDALAYFDDHLGDTSGALWWKNSNKGEDEVLKKFRSLTPAELDAVVNGMSKEQLQRLDGKLGSGGKDERTAWTSLLLSELGPEAIARLQKGMKNLEPAPDGDDKYPLYDTAEGPLFGKDGVDLKKDLIQGGLGDCWFLSGIGAIAEQDPSFFPKHIEENANGTYTVTFYKDGKPVKVTVDNELRGGQSPTYAQTENTMWVAIYEKAYAQFKGSYGVLGAGGFGDESLRDLTGGKTRRANADDVSLADVDGMLRQGRAVTIGTRDDGELGVDGFTDNDKIVTSHEYFVQSVNPKAHPPTITLVNPWNDNGTAKDNKSVPRTVTLTEDQFHTYCDEVSSTESAA
jgi:hypothetical protein